MLRGMPAGIEVLDKRRSLGNEVRRRRSESSSGDIVMSVEELGIKLGYWILGRRASGEGLQLAFLSLHCLAVCSQGMSAAVGGWDNEMKLGKKSWWQNLCDHLEI